MVPVSTCMIINLSYRNLEDTTAPIYSADAHKEIINSIDGIGGQNIGCGAPEIVTGSRDGEIYYLKSNTHAFSIAALSDILSASGQCVKCH